MNTTNLSGTVAGSTFQYDVPTKCTATKELLIKLTIAKNKKLPQKEFTKECNLAVVDIAMLYDVTPPTVKSWLKKYYHTYETYITLPQGTMRVANSLFKTKSDITKAKTLLMKHKRERIEIMTAADAEYLRKCGVRQSYKEIDELKNNW